MPWKECHVVDERLRFVARLLGEKMAVLCEEFGISRKTGYKIYERYQDIGVPGHLRAQRDDQRSHGAEHIAAFTGTDEKAAVAGDVAMLQSEVTPVLKALRKDGSSPFITT